MWVTVVGIFCAGGSLPAFLADTGERVTANYTGASVLTWAGQTAAVLGYVTGGSSPTR